MIPMLLDHGYQVTSITGTDYPAGYWSAARLVISKFAGTIIHLDHPPAWENQLVSLAILTPTTTGGNCYRSQHIITYQCILNIYIYIYQCLPICAKCLMFEKLYIAGGDIFCLRTIFTFVFAGSEAVTKKADETAKITWKIKTRKLKRRQKYETAILRTKGNHLSFNLRALTLPGWITKKQIIYIYISAIIHHVSQYVLLIAPSKQLEFECKGLVYLRFTDQYT